MCIGVRNTELLIINASALHPSSRNPIFDSLWEFAYLKLLNDNHNNPGKLKQLIDHKYSMLVGVQVLAAMPAMIKVYRTKAVTQLIERFKLGGVDSQTFVDGLLDAFFPHLSDIDFPVAQKQMIIEQQALYVSLNLPVSGLPAAQALTSRQVAKALVEDAWGVRIQSIDKTYQRRIIDIFRQAVVADVDALRIVSNSNPIDMRRFIYHLHLAFPKHVSCPLDIDWQNMEHRSVRIGDCGKPINLDVSFRYQAHKTERAALGTNGMLSSIAVGKRPQSVRVMSQWQGDLLAARQLGMQAYHLPDFSTEPSAPVIAVSAVLAFTACALIKGPKATVGIGIVGALGLLLNSKVHDFGPFAAGVMFGQLAGVAGDVIASLRP